MRLWEQRMREYEARHTVALTPPVPPEDRGLPVFAVVTVNLWPDVARKHCRSCTPTTVDGKDVLRGEVLLEGLTWDDAYDQALILRDAREILGS